MIFLAVAALPIQAQISDDFTDGDFTDDPTWVGDISDFTVDGGQLRSNGPESSSVLHLSVANDQIDDATWEFSVLTTFAPSSTNFMRIFLASDVSNLEGDLNGYFIEIGQSGDDDLNFYRKEGSSETLLQSGDVNLSGNINIGIQVTRDASANWTVSADLSGGTSYTEYISSFNDNITFTPAYFGFVADYNTASRYNQYYFDNVSITSGDPAFQIESLVVESSNSLRVTFNQDVDETTAENTSNYSLDNGFGSPSTAEVDVSNADQVVLTYSESFANNSYTLNVDGVQNADTDESISDSDIGIEVEVATTFRDIMINEIMADPSPVVGLTNAEFVELFNAGAQAINIGNFEIEGQAIEDYVLASGAYVIVVEDTDADLFMAYPNVVEIESLGLTNGGEPVELRDNLGNLVDSVTYETSWYQDASKDDGGYTLEQINPELACSYEDNWTASNDSDGGTPGSENSVYNNSPDTDGPNLIEVVSIDINTLRLTFDEPMDETAMNSATYQVTPGISVNDFVVQSPGYFVIEVNTVENLQSDVDYTVTVTGATDCAGNSAATNSLDFSFDNEPPVLDEIIVKTNNEITLVFNEALLESVAEDEDNFAVDNGIGVPDQATLDNENLNEVDLAFETDFTVGLEYTITISDLVDLSGNALVTPIDETFIFSEGIDTVIVVSASHLRVFFVSDIQESSATNTENYAVDDEIGAPISAFMNNEVNNMVNLIFQTEFDDNRTLTLSASNILDSEGDPIATPNYEFIYDTSPPKLDTLIVASANQLEVEFLEKVERVSAESAEHYEYEDIFPISAQLNENQQTVELIFAEDFEREVEFELLIDEVADLSGNSINTRIKETFVYDVFPPEIQQVIVKAPDQLKVVFNEAIEPDVAGVPANYSVGGVGNPITIDQNLEFLNEITLTFSEDLPEIGSLQFTASSMIDNRSNEVDGDLQASFSNNQLSIGELLVLGAKSLQVEFNKDVDQSAAETTSNYLLNQETHPSSANFNERIGTLQFSEIFENKQLNTLVVASIDGQNLAQTEYIFEFDSKLESATILDNSTIEIDFEVNLENDVDLDESNFNLIPSVGNPLAAVVSTEDHSILRLIYNESIQPDTDYTLAWSNVNNEFGNRIPDNEVSLTMDETPPLLLELTVLDAQLLVIHFSEPLLESSAEFANNYQLNPKIGYAHEATYASADTTVTVVFDQSLEDQTAYTLTISNIKDELGNAAEELTASFTYIAPYMPQFAELIITEVYPDPEDDESEFFELYNPTADTIHLTGLTLQDLSGSTHFTSGSVAPGQYIIITDDEAQFEGRNVGAVSSWLSLNNSGDLLAISSSNGLIHSISYDSDWYKSEEKSDGGYSLEMVDTANPCGDFSNWTGSDNPGGTPGLENSVRSSNPDSGAPNIISAIATETNFIEIRLNERLAPVVGDFQSLIATTPTIVIDSAVMDVFTSDAIQLALLSDLDSTQSYQITLSGLQDCVGNALDSETSTTDLLLPLQADSLDILINEVLFNPRSGGVDFIELYNNSEKFINLSGWYVADASDALKTITNDNLIIRPQEYLALTSDPDILAADYPTGDRARFARVSGMPNFNDDADSVMLFNANRTPMDLFFYLDDYHFSLLDDDEGVTLERINFDAPTMDASNWQSAASTVGFATPGLPNSQMLGELSGDGMISIEPKVFYPDNTGINDFTTISFETGLAGSFANVQIFDTSGRMVRTLAENELLSTRGFLTWDGTSNAGELAGIGYYVVWFEIFDANGNKRTAKETVVLGARF